MNKISVFGWRTRTLWMLVSIIAVAAVYVVLRDTDNPLPLVDSVTSVTSIIATLFMFRHKLEAWIVWLINDIFYIAEYVMLPDKAIFLICLYVIWTLLAVASYVNWRRILQTSAPPFP